MSSASAAPIPRPTLAIFRAHAMRRLSATQHRGRFFNGANPAGEKRAGVSDTHVPDEAYAEACATFTHFILEGRRPPPKGKIVLTVETR
jgi:hypothetical protein